MTHVEVRHFLREYVLRQRRETQKKKEFDSGTAELMVSNIGVNQRNNIPALVSQWRR